LEALPPRLPEQPIFYPVENEAYARQIARDWNVKSSGSGFVLRFSVEASFMTKYPLQQVGAAVHREYWIPAEDLDDMNDHIVGQIRTRRCFWKRGDRVKAAHGYEASLFAERASTSRAY
jgi:hypothetical protein